MNNLKITCLIEDVPFLSEMVRAGFVARTKQFSEFSPVFGDGYLARYDESAQTVNDIIAPSQLTGEMKKITASIAAMYRQARNMLNRLEFIVASAKGSLTVAPRDFGFKNIRSQISRKNDEGLAKSLHDLLNLLAANQAVLEEKGLTPEYVQEVEQFVNDFTDASLGQTRKLQERMKRVAENTEKINEHWNMITKLCKAGKIIGKAADDKDMIKEFTMTELKKKVRVQRKEEEKDED